MADFNSRWQVTRDAPVDANRWSLPPPGGQWRGMWDQPVLVKNLVLARPSS
jgi:hypothetical protein